MTINLTINGNSLRLEVEPDEEKYYRQAARLLNNLIDEYVPRFKTLSHDQILTLISLDVAVNLCRSEAQLNEITGMLSEDTSTGD